MFVYHMDTGASENHYMYADGHSLGGIIKHNTIYDIDIPGRAVYFISLSNFWQSYSDRPTRLVRYNIDTKSFDDLGVTPRQDDLYYPQLVWDSVNRVLLWNTTWDWPQSEIWIYHPDTNIWEKDPMFQPDGLKPTGNFFAFDPHHNAFILLGCGDACHDYGALAAGSGNYLYLYRYGIGK